ncbi:MAG: hypothetical protein JRJ27_06865 [Deltaproteobacteria bacterium]|nr:hypothetical protein [Deltaproteobacteria bacterium]
MQKKTPKTRQKQTPNTLKKQTSVFEILAIHIKINPLILTVATPLFVVFLVIIYGIIKTSGSHQVEYEIDSWQAGKQMIRHSGKGLSLIVDSKPSYILYRIPEHQQRSVEFSCEISLQQPVRPNILLHYRHQRQPQEKVGFRVVDLSNQIHSTAKNAIHIKFDDYEDLIHANELVLSFASSHGKNIITLKNPRLKTLTFSNRFKQVMKALFRRQPLTQGSNNFILSQRINGHGYLYFLWFFVIFSILLLLFRRLIIRTKFSVVIHISVTLVIIVILADLRNMHDYFQNSLTAFKLKSQSNSLAEHLGNHENRFRWFGDVVAAIQKELPNGGRYFAKIEGRQRGIRQAVKRAYYYVRPALPTDNVSGAKIAVFYNVSIEDFDHSPEWQLKTLYPSGVYVYVKSQ